MSDTWVNVLALIKKNEIRISDHGYDELSNDAIAVRDILNTANESVVIEDYPEYPKGPCVLTLQKDEKQNPIHVVWGLPKGAESPAVLVTSYRPDPKRWNDDFTRRRK